MELIVKGKVGSGRKRWFHLKDLEMKGLLMGKRIVGGRICQIGGPPIERTEMDKFYPFRVSGATIVTPSKGVTLGNLVGTTLSMSLTEVTDPANQRLFLRSIIIEEVFIKT